jgi:hypothetical protein
MDKIKQWLDPYVRNPHIPETLVLGIISLGTATNNPLFRIRRN